MGLAQPRLRPGVVLIVQQVPHPSGEGVRAELPAELRVARRQREVAHLLRGRGVGAALERELFHQPLVVVEHLQVGALGPGVGAVHHHDEEALLHAQRVLV